MGICECNNVFSTFMDESEEVKVFCPGGGDGIHLRESPNLSEIKDRKSRDGFPAKIF